MNRLAAIMIGRAICRHLRASLWSAAYGCDVYKADRTTCASMWAAIVTMRANVLHLGATCGTMIIVKRGSLTQRRHSIHRGHAGF